MAKGAMGIEDKSYKKINKYLLMIKNKDARQLVANFFERSVISDIPKREINKLISAINEDVEKGIFKMERNEYNKIVLNSFNKMTEEQKNSKTHKIFLNIIKNNFGKSAYKLINRRNNLNIFNLKEVHVLHQEIFDSFGEDFVNRIINVNLTPHSLMVLKDVLSDKEKKKDFKYFYDFYNKNIGKSQVDFERMIRGYASYKSLIHELRVSKKKVTNIQKISLIEIFKNVDNIYNINSINKVDKFYDIKQKEYVVNKNKASSLMKKGDSKEALRTLANAIFKNYYSMDMDTNYGYAYTISSNNPYILYRYFDVEDIFHNASTREKFSEKEIEHIRKIVSIIDIVEKGEAKDFEKLLLYAEGLEKEGNVIGEEIIDIMKKIPKAVERDIVKSITSIDEVERRAKSNEKDVFVELQAKTKEGVAISNPVYVFDGANFSFLSTTNLVEGLSGIKTEGDFAKSWFEYENGTSHISASYCNQDRLSNMEFQKSYSWKKGMVTYLLEDVDLLSMGPSDIMTPHNERVSDVNSDYNTKFMTAAKLIEKSGDISYNEVAINRFDYSSQSIEYGGKIIPSAILCCNEVGELQRQVAEAFTKYCVENGLKPKGWEMPIVVVKEKKYFDRQNERKRELLKKNSENILANVNDEEKIAEAGFLEKTVKEEKKDIHVKVK